MVRRPLAFHFSLRPDLWQWQGRANQKAAVCDTDWQQDFFLLSHGEVSLSAPTFYNIRSLSSEFSTVKDTGFEPRDSEVWSALPTSHHISVNEPQHLLPMSHHIWFSKQWATTSPRWPPPRWISLERGSHKVALLI